MIVFGKLHSIHPKSFSFNIVVVDVFGSIATGEMGAWSDVDLIIVKDSSLPFVERPREFFNLLDIGVPIDILVYSPTEFDELKDSDSGFWKEFRRNNIRVI